MERQRIPLSLLVSVAALSAAVLGYELLLLRLFPLKLWAPVTGAVISLALLGYGAAGTTLALVQRRAVPRFGRLYPGAACGFGLAAPAAFAVAEAVPVNPLELPWSLEPWIGLTGVYLVLAVPFFLAAFGLGLVYRLHGRRAGRVYGWDLAGAALGAALAVGFVHVAPPGAGLRGVMTLGFAAAALAAPARRPAGALVAMGVLTAGLWPARMLEPAISPYKPVSQALAGQGARVLADRWTAWGRMTVVASDRVPLRHAPGLSLTCPDDPPPSAAAFLGGELLDAVPFPERRWAAAACLPWALAYRLRPGASALVLEAGLGFRPGAALWLGAAKVVAVEPVRFPTGVPRTGGAIRWVWTDPRGFLARTRDRFDVIDVAAPGPFRRAGPPADLITVEGTALALGRLTEGGLLSVSAGAEVPPRTCLQVLSTLAAALERVGRAPPARCVVFVRSWGAVQILAAPDGFTGRDIDRVRALCDRAGFDLPWVPGMDPTWANRWHRLDRPWFFEAAREILTGDRQGFESRYPFRIGAVTDDRPGLGRTLRWGRLSEWLGARRVGGAGLVEGEPLVQATAIGLAVVFGGLTILVPLTRQGLRGSGRSGWYFGGIGVGFMGCEVALVETLGRVLGDPTAGAGLALAGLLAAAGAGAARSRGASPRQSALVCAAAAAGLGLGLGPLRLAVEGAGGVLRFAAAAAVVAATGWALGRPFPSGLSAVAGHDPERVPWAWGVNGFASVWGAALAGFLTAEQGRRAVLGLAAAAYLVAAAAGPLGWGGRKRSG